MTSYLGDPVLRSAGDSIVPSGTSDWPLLARFIDREARIAAWAARRRYTLFLYEFVRFGVKQAWACLFAALMLALIVGTWACYPKGAWLARYDFLVVAAIAIQGVMLWARLETPEEGRIILVFHVVGTVMEIFKTSMGSWIYPEESLLRIGGVPLFTGFMYAAVGSFMARCWRLFDFRFTRHPPLWALGVLSVAIYINFFTHHFMWDIRPALILAAVLLLGPGVIHYKIWRVHRRMPLLLAAVLTAGFIWLAENIGTFTSAWIYPHQRGGWTLVSLAKLNAWFLLMILSYTMVAALNGVERSARAANLERKCEANYPSIGFASVRWIPRGAERILSVFGRGHGSFNLGQLCEKRFERGDDVHACIPEPIDAGGFQGRLLLAGAASEGDVGCPGALQRHRGCLGEFGVTLIRAADAGDFGATFGEGAAGVGAVGEAVGGDRAYAAGSEQVRDPCGSGGVLGLASEGGKEDARW